MKTAFRLFALVALLFSACALAQVPPSATAHRAEMTRSALRVFGPQAPIAELAAQIHQESAWRADAVSWVGAQGLAQFMPATAADMAKFHPAECAPANPFSARWAFACRDRYMRTLLRMQRPLATGASLDACSEWLFAFRGYNGGAGWILRDRRAALAAGADPDDWRAVAPFNAGRRASAHRENREYPERIVRLAPRYVAAGWGRSLECQA
jgi:membrane-bound lytic murein transglycosylase MltF